VNWKFVREPIAVVALTLLAATSSAQSPVPKAVAPLGKAKLTRAAVEAKLARLTELCQKNQRKEVVEEFGDEDIVAWLNAFENKAEGTSKAVNALHKRGTSFSAVGNIKRAREDFEKAIELSPSNGHMWNSLGGVYQRMGDDGKALDAYNKAYEYDRAAHTKKSFGWMPISATLNAANILMGQTKYPEALETLERYNDEDIQKMGTYWGCRMLRAYGQVYLATGREEEAMTKFNTALERERKQDK